MKQKLTLLMLALFFSVGAWAETYTITYDTTTGTFYRGGSASSDWSSKWVSKEAGKPVVTITTSVNNMNGANGRIAPQTYTITVEDGYVVTGFAMNCPTFGGTITVTPNGESATEVATGETIVVNSSASSFVFSGVSGARIQAASSDGGSFLIYVEDDPNYVDWTPSISNEAFVTVGEKVASISPVTEASDNSKWYILTQVRDGESPMYNVGTGSQLKRTATSITPATINGTQATSSLQYLVRFIEVGTGLYNMQFANGEFITSSLTTSASHNEAGNYAFYNSNGGSGSYFGWNLNSNTGSRVDNNGAGYTVAFWGSGTVSGTSGNNVWYVYSTEVAVPSTTYTYQISDESGVVFTSDPYSATPGDVISTIPSSLQRAYCNYSVTSTTIVAGENTVPVTVSYNLPFTTSTSFDNATWYYATLRGKYLRADDSAKDGSGRYATNASNEHTDAYKWAFFGNPYTNIYIMNKNQGDSKYLYKETQLVFKSDITPTSDNNALFEATPNSNGGFTLRNIAGGATWYINDAGGNGNLGFWNSASGANDNGSNWVVTAVPAIEVDVTYELWVGGQKVNTIVVEKVAANSAVSIPASLIANYSDLAYDIETSGTIGEENCTITVTATLKSGIVLPSELVNNRMYQLFSTRGALSTYTDETGTYLASPCKTSLSVSAKNFAILSYNDKYYLYSVSDSKFVTYQEETLASLKENVTGTSDAISFSQTTNSVFQIRFDGSASKIINSSGSYTYGIAINGWGSNSGQWDDGNQYIIVDNGSFDASSALAALETSYRGFFDEAIAALEAIDWGSDPNQYSFSGVLSGYAGSEETMIAGTKSAGYSLERYNQVQAMLANFAINIPPTNAFYRIKGYSNNYITSNTAASNASMDGTESANNIIYYSEDKNLIFYGSGYGLYNTSIVAPAGSTLNAYTFMQGAQMGKYYIKSNATGVGTYCYDNTSNGTKVDRNGSPVTTGSYQTDWTLTKITSLPVTISSVGIATLYSPVALTIPTGVTAYVAIDKGEYLSLTAIEGGIIPASTGVILVGDEGTYDFDITTGGSVGSNALSGTVYAISRPTGSYVLSTQGGTNVGFYNTGASTIPGFKAYLPAGTGDVKFFRFDDEDAINSIAAEEEEVGCYDLSGRRVKAPVRGLYILNGKKVIVK